MVFNGKVRRIRHINIHIFLFFSKLENMDFWGGCCIRFVGSAILLPKHANDTTIPLRIHILPEKNNQLPLAARSSRKKMDPFKYSCIVVYSLSLCTVQPNIFWRGCSYARLPCITVDKAKHYIGIYGQRTINLCGKFQSYTKSSKNGQTCSARETYRIGVCKLYIKHHFVARKRKTCLPCHESQKAMISV